MTDSTTPADRPVALVHGLGGSAAMTWQHNGWMDLIADAGRHAKIAAAIEGNADPTDPFSRYFTDLTNDPDGDPEALRALLKSPGEKLTPERLAPVTMPVLVLLGDKDFAGPATPLVDALADVQFVELKNCDHFATPRSMQCLEEALAFVDAAPF